MLPEEANRSYYRARYYDPNSGRFISEDPLRFEGWINFYAYTQNSPLVWIDPSGENQCFSVTPNGMTEIPCSDTIHVVVQMPPRPPAGPLHYHDTSPGCACNPQYLMTQVQNIKTEERNKNFRTGVSAVAEAGVLEGYGHVAGHFVGGPVAAVALVADIIFGAQDAYEMWERHKRTQERIRDLFAPCEQ